MMKMELLRKNGVDVGSGSGSGSGSGWAVVRIELREELGEEMDGDGEVYAKTDSTIRTTRTVRRCLNR